MKKISFKGIGEFSIHFCMNMICSIIRFQLNLKVKQKKISQKMRKRYTFVNQYYCTYL